MTNPTTAPCCPECGRHEDEAPPSFSWYLNSLSASRCPECGTPQGADVEGELAELRAENERLLKEVATAWFERDEARYGLLEMHRERNEARDDNERLREVLQSLIEQKKIVNVRKADGTYIDVTAWCKAALEQE
jgi:hypothetical protein